MKKDKKVNGDFINKKTNELKRMLRSTWGIKSFVREEDREKIFEGINVIDNELKKATNDVDLKPSEDIAIMFEDIFSTYFHRIILGSIDENIRGFFIKLVELVSNWNKLVGDEKLDETMSSFMTFIEYHKNTVATIESMKILLKEVRKYRDFAPPAFELSKHYLKSIDDSL